jgi:outer membrane protein OmpA-like peptidoglycan-associated protein
MKYSSTAAIVLASAAIWGCAAGPSQQLVDARSAFQAASTGSASEFVPEKLEEARAALKDAEQAYEDDPASASELSLAYIAHRKALEATALGKAARLEQRAAEGKDREQAILVGQRNVAEMSLQDTERELGMVRTALAVQGEVVNDGARRLQAREEELSLRQRELAEERTARIDAEKNAAAALERLNAIGKVKHENRQLVITLSGAVLFESGKAALLPAARRSLDDVAAALKTQDAKKQITISGYTDSVGTDAANQRLSQARAESVRAYLVSQSVKAQRVTAVGRGEESPVAGNKTAEGRANNRRVEIVVEN